MDPMQSGAEVPTASTVTPITSIGICSQCARPSTTSTNANVSTPNQIIDIMKIVLIYGFVACVYHNSEMRKKLRCKVKPKHKAHLKSRAFNMGQQTEIPSDLERYI